MRDCDGRFRAALRLNFSIVARLESECDFSAVWNRSCCDQDALALTKTGIMHFQCRRAAYYSAELNLAVFRRFNLRLKNAAT